MYWAEPRVAAFLEELGFENADFDGCMYGLTLPDARKEHLRIQKPWRIACLNSTLPRRLSARCDASHAHHPCEGRDTQLTQGYTKGACSIIAGTIRADAPTSARTRRP
eukprot:3726291-Alexandrium_andersonii.AAC.1